MPYFRIIPAILFALGAIVSAEPADHAASDHPASAALLADVSAIKPGDPFEMGILFKMKPGWHVYWKNPGDSGMPPSVKWDLPKGFQISDLNFPVPKKFDEPGGLVAYGYADEVLLTATVSAPADLKPGMVIRIGCEASWLVCEQVCLPGEAKLSIELPVSDLATPANRDVFEAWRERMPIPASEVGARVSTAGDKQAGELHLLIAWPEAAPARAEWFAPASSDLVFTDIEVIDDGWRTIVKFKASALAGKSPPFAVPESLLAYDTPDGKRHGIVLDAFEIPRGTSR